MHSLSFHSGINPEMEAFSPDTHGDSDQTTGNGRVGKGTKALKLHLAP